MSFLIVFSFVSTDSVNIEKSHFLSFFNQDIVWTGLVLPVIFLLLCALIKNFSGTENKDHAIWLSLIAEVSIDIMSIMTTWIMTYFVLRNENGANIRTVALVPLLLSMVLAYTHSMWRNSIIKDTKSSAPHYIRDWICVIAMILISAGWLLVVINFYFKWIQLIS